MKTTNMMQMTCNRCGYKIIEDQDKPAEQWTHISRKDPNGVEYVDTDLCPICTSEYQTLEKRQAEEFDEFLNTDPNQSKEAGK